jgi:hypothetical protein
MIFLTAAPAENRLIWSGGICASPWQTGAHQHLEALDNSSALPVNFLDVIVHAHRQTIAPFGAPSFNDPTPIRSSHARTETMDAQTAADLGLISAFWHDTSYLIQ